MSIFNPIEIGGRIRKLRKENGLNQAQFAEALGMSSESRQSVRLWENGERLPPLDALVKMCDLFNCEAGYLLGEFSLPTKEKTDVQKATGLSQKAIEKILVMKMEHPNIFPFLDQIITHEEFYYLVLGLSSSIRYLRPYPDTIFAEASELAREISKNGFAVLPPEDAAVYWLQQSCDTWKRIVNDIWKEDNK